MLRQKPLEICLNHPNRIKKTYDRFSSLYDPILKPCLEFGRKRSIELLEPTSGAKILEIGVGTGLSLEYYPPNVEVIGFDYSFGMLSEAQIKTKKINHYSTHLIQMDAQNMAFTDCSFDYVFAAYVLTVVPDPSKAIAELFRVARPGAKIVIINYICNKNKFIGLIENAFHPIFASTGLFTLNHDLLGLLKNRGANDIKVEPTSFLSTHFIISFTVPE